MSSLCYYPSTTVWENTKREFSYLKDNILECPYSVFFWAPPIFQLFPMRRERRERAIALSVSFQSSPTFFRGHPSTSGWKIVSERLWCHHCEWSSPQHFSARTKCYVDTQPKGYLLQGAGSHMQFTISAVATYSHPNSSYTDAVSDLLAPLFSVAVNMCFTLWSKQKHLGKNDMVGLRTTTFLPCVCWTHLHFHS